MAKVKDDPQANMFDRVVELPELEAAIEDELATREAASTHRNAKKTRDDLVAALGIGVGERVRAGPYSILGQERRGGGFAVPPWTKVVPQIGRADKLP